MSKDKQKKIFQNKNEFSKKNKETDKQQIVEDSVEVENSIKKEPIIKKNLWKIVSKGAGVTILEQNGKEILVDQIIDGEIGSLIER